MSPNSVFAKVLRYIGIIFMGLTAGFTLLGGIGTSCVAFNPDGFGDTMAKLAPFQALYVVFVLAGIALGIFGIRATVRLVKGTRTSYVESLSILVAGVVIGAIHMVYSRSLRGSSMPVDAVVYVTVLTLIIFLLFRLPPIWQGVDFTKGKTETNRPAGGVAAILLGVLSLTIHNTMGSTHIWNGVNYAATFNLTMTVIGITCLLLGAVLVTGLIPSKMNASRKSIQEKTFKA